jgi:integrase
VAAPYPKLPPMEMSFIQFAVCAILADGAKSTGKIRDILLDQMGWDAGPAGAFSILRNFEAAGVVHAIPFDDSKNRVFQLTQIGLQRIRDAVAFYRTASERWGKQIEALSPDLLPSAGRQIPRETVKQRLPTHGEFARIKAAASPQLASILRFSEVVGCRTYDFVNARIEGFDAKKSELTIEPKSMTGRAITDRVIEISPSAQEILEEIIGSRKSGLIFTTQTGRPWRASELSRSFLKARSAAGVLPEVVLAGRGGWVARELERKSAVRKRRKKSTE